MDTSATLLVILTILGVVLVFAQLRLFKIAQLLEEIRDHLKKSDVEQDVAVVEEPKKTVPEKKPQKPLRGWDS
jgi:hypothetical protein